MKWFLSLSKVACVIASWLAFSLFQASQVTAQNIPSPVELTNHLNELLRNKEYNQLQREVEYYLPMARQMTNVSFEVTLLHYWSLSEAFEDDLEKAERIADQAVRLVRQSQSRELQALVYRGRAQIFRMADEMEKADEDLRRAIRLVEDVGVNDRRLWLLRLELMETLNARQDLDELYEEASSLWEDVRDTDSDEAIATARYLIEAHFSRGEYAAAREIYEEVEDAIDDRPHLSVIRLILWSQLHAVNCAEGRVDERVIRRIRRALEEPSEIPGDDARLMVSRVIDSWLFNKDRSINDVPEELTSLAGTPLPRGRKAASEIHYLRARGDLLVVSGHKREAKRLYARALELAEERDMPDEKARLLLASLALVEVGNGDEEWNTIAETLTELCPLDEERLLPAMRGQVFFSLAAWHAHAGRLSQSAEYAHHTAKVYHELAPSQARVTRANIFKQYSFYRNFGPFDFLANAGAAERIAEFLATKKGELTQPLFDDAARDNLSWRERERWFEKSFFLKKEEGKNVEDEVASAVAAIEKAEVNDPAGERNDYQDFEGIQKALPKNTVLLDFVVFHPLSFKGNDIPPRRFGVVAYGPEVQAKWIDLGDYTQIKSLCDSIQGMLLAGNVRETKLAEALKSGFEKIWLPISEAVGEVPKTVLISADAPLGTVPFAVLLNPQEEMLLQRHDFAFTPNVRALLAETRSRRRPGPSAGFFVSKSTPLTAKPLPGLSALPDLDGALQEADIFRRHFSGENPEVYLDADASPETLAGVSNPQVLHLCAHAQYLPRALDSELGTALAKAESGAERQPVFLANGFFRNCLVLGWENSGEEADSSFESLLPRHFSTVDFCRLKLGGTELVAISGCSTHLADALGGEGQVGIQRALHYAGAKDVILSLRNTSDHWGPVFFDGFYSLFAEQDTIEAFANAQRAIYAKAADSARKEGWLQVASYILSVSHLADQ
jgi:CHAT domain-containing protein/tetratricopeptide (TPR) repeat protein